MPALKTSSVALRLQVPCSQITALGLAEDGETLTAEESTSPVHGLKRTWLP